MSTLRRPLYSAGNCVYQHSSSQRIAGYFHNEARQMRRAIHMKMRARTPGEPVATH